jgi:NADPH:quinone reductase-like Zn-dependent oxidoreductase
MKAVFLEKPGGPLAVRDLPVPVPGRGEVLVRMAAAPVNPSDIARIKTAHLDCDLGTFVPGLEGSGTVVAGGGGLLPRLWLGKRVACAAHNPNSGTWAEYIVTPATACFPLSKDVDDEQGSMTLVNPLTALAFFDIARRGKHKALISNAAASALGKMIILLGKRNRLPVINIVRREEQAATLESLGARHVLVSSRPGFIEQLSALSHELNATLLFDSVCGKGFGALLGALPYGSRAVVYGNLSGEEFPEFDPKNILANNLTITGFYLANQARGNGLIKNILNLRKVGSLMRSGMTTVIHRNFPLEKAQEALDTYLANMSAGKVILKPGMKV